MTRYDFRVLIIVFPVRYYDYEIAMLIRNLEVEIWNYNFGIMGFEIMILSSNFSNPFQTSHLGSPIPEI